VHVLELRIVFAVSRGLHRHHHGKIDSLRQKQPVTTLRIRVNKLKFQIWALRSQPSGKRCQELRSRRRKTTQSKMRRDLFACFQRGCFELFPLRQKHLGTLHKSTPRQRQSQSATILRHQLHSQTFLELSKLRGHR
jgi:hypothetical protein